MNIVKTIGASRIVLRGAFFVSTSFAKCFSTRLSNSSDFIVKKFLRRYCQSIRLYQKKGGGES